MMRGRAILAAAALSLAGLAACGPQTVAQAERSCMDDARLAIHPRTEVALGIGSGGRSAVGISTSLSSDYLTGRDPADVFDRCVLRRSGELPTRPLAAQPGWRG
ncbi:hypothetical protein KTN05_02165 [Paracoccus sp. Z118]|uniref:hypothetical protein n=1 Tax=Paracoccus sp. Z118 TaxID=2851017 RepID=UPI001C2C5713|nr:hypothetical protein [Paracoccus sp. Z118]MBV0890654.1 hypothetical protein [Paracoccus sp. Z118]